MRVAILESIVMPAGHEVEFDRILVNELKRQGHEPVFFVPENFPFKVDYGADVEYLDGGEAVTYAGAGKLKKLYLSAVREYRRKKWFDSAMKKAEEGRCDAIIVPTATYRYLRTARNSRFKEGKTPVLFIIHGINPKEKERFLKEVKRCFSFSNLHFGVITLRDDFNHILSKQLHKILPPVFMANSLQCVPPFYVHQPLRLGFFGQYRKEKNLEFFLEAFKDAQFTSPVTLIVQGATAKPEDGEDFERLAKKYESCKGIQFWHKSLIGDEWEKALLDVDIILMPYAAERYRYHWGAMLFTAIGYNKPVLQSPEMNPEVLAQFPIGEAVQMDSVEAFREQLETFVNTFEEKKEGYRKALEEANQCYGQKQLIQSIIAIIQGE